MAIKTYNDQNFVAIANAIRSKSKNPTTYKPSEMAAAISAIESGFELLPQDTVSGAIANFPDGSDGYPVVELIANIEPKQSGSGDPAPDNVRPISGSTEVALTHFKKNYISTSMIEQGGIDATSGQDTASNSRVRTTFIKVNPNTTYTVAVNSSNTNLVVFHILEYRSDNSYIGSSNVTIATKTFVTGANTAFVRFTARDTTNVNITPADLANWQLEVGSSATAFEAYSEEVKTIDLGRTVCGGTLNVTTGGLNSSYKLANLSEFTWEYDSTTYAFGIFQTTGNISDKAANKNFICEIYKNAGNYRGTLADKEIGVFNNTTGLRRICIRDDSLTSLQDFESAIIGKKIAYEITTPETYSIDPETNIKTNLGVNNIYADTGNVSVTYRANIDLYIAKKIAEGA